MRTWRLVLGVGALTVLLSGCWPFPGAGPDRRSHNPFERDLTPATVGRLTEAFRQPLADGSGPPVVSRRGLFVRSGRTLVALEPNTGALRWSVEMVEGTAESYMSEPHILDDRDQVLASVSIYGPGATFGDDLVTLDASTGAEEGRHSSQAGVGSVRGTDVGLIGSDFTDGFTNTWIGVQPVDGDQRWGGLAEDLGSGNVISLGRTQVFMASGDVRAYDTTVACPPYIPDHPLLICSSQWQRSVGGAATPVVIGDDSTVYAGSANGNLYALRSDSGGIRWRAELGSPVRQAPALADGVLYVTTADGRLSALPAGGCGTPTCAPTWTTEAYAGADVQPAVAGGVVYVASPDASVSAFAAAGCAAPICPPLWTADTGTAPVSGGLAVYSGRLYVGTGDGLVAYGLPRA